MADTIVREGNYIVKVNSFRYLSLPLTLVIAFTFFAIASCQSSDPQLLAIPQVTYEDFDLIAVDELVQDAIIEAKKWEEDSYLELIQLAIFLKDDIRNSAVSFGFESPSKQAGLMISYTSEDAELVAHMQEFDYQGIEIYAQRPSLFIANIDLDSVKAFNYFYQSWGETFISENPSPSFSIYMSLEPNRYDESDTANPEWRIIFGAGELGLDATLEIIIDAKTYELLEIRDH